MRKQPQDLLALLQQALDLPQRMLSLKIEFDASRGRNPLITIERYEFAPDGGYEIDGNAARTVREQYRLQLVENNVGYVANSQPGSEG